MNHSEDDLRVAISEMDIELSKLRLAAQSTNWTKAQDHLKSIQQKNQRTIKTFSGMLGSNGSNHKI